MAQIGFSGGAIHYAKSHLQTLPWADGQGRARKSQSMTDPIDTDPTDTECMCDFGDDECCNGTGTLKCYGCGGDTCVCQCGGEMDCEGCGACEDSER